MSTSCAKLFKSSLTCSKSGVVFTGSSVPKLLCYILFEKIFFWLLVFKFCIRFSKTVTRSPRELVFCSDRGVGLLLPLERDRCRSACRIELWLFKLMSPWSLNALSLASYCILLGRPATFWRLLIAWSYLWKCKTISSLVWPTFCNRALTDYRSSSCVSAKLWSNLTSLLMFIILSSWVVA